MHRRSKIAALAAVVLALATLVAASGASTAAPAASKPTRQEIAQRLLASRRPQFMTPSALAAVTMIANGSKALSPTGRNPAAEGQPAGTRAGTQAVPLAPAQLPNVRVNDPSRDRQFIDQTTQSETTIAVHGNNVAVGYNDSQRTLLVLTAASDLTGYSFPPTVATRSPTAGRCPTRKAMRTSATPGWPAPGAGASSTPPSP